MKPTSEILNALPHFHGSETWTRWSPLFSKDLLTDGAKYVAESCEAYWLMDAIASWQHEPSVRYQEFQVWTLKRPVGKDFWVLVGDDGNDNQIAHQVIEYSDFPLDSIKLFAVPNELGGVIIMLPGEY